jgi:hypothetical protein
VAVVLLAFALACDGVGLTGEASGDEVDVSASLSNRLG